MSLSQDQTRRLLALADKLAGPIRDAFIAAIKAKAATLNAAEVEAALGDAILTGNAERLTAMLKLTPDQVFPITEAIRSSYIAGLSFGKEGLPITLQANFGFGGNPRAVAAVRDLVTKLTGEISQGQIDATRALVAGVVDNGIPVRTMALDIVGRKGPDGVRVGGYLGLDGPRTAQAAKVAAMLRDPAMIKDYFLDAAMTKPRYTTTDRRFDARVRRAIKEGRALTADEAAGITTQHRARLLKNRADTISRTESLNALRAGNMDGYRNLVASGDLQESRIVRTWLATMDGRTRHDHMIMNGKEVRGLSQPFTFPDQTQAMYPGDGSLDARPEDLILCRCTQYITLTKRGQL